MRHPPKFWYNPQEKPSHINRLWLSGLAKIYQYGYQRRLASTPSYKSDKTVICVGNVTVGGGGKTPLVQYINRLISKSSYKSVVLMRGYGTKHKKPYLLTSEDDFSTVGDEALLHQQLTEVVISPHRGQGAAFIDTELTQHDIIVMDDGLQNPQLHKDISLLMIDGTRGLGNQQILPRGPLREPMEEALKRVDAIIIVGDDRFHLGKRYKYLKPVFNAQIKPRFSSKDTRLQPNKNIIGFAGIANPEKFFTTLKQLPLNLLATHSFPDHAPYTPAQLRVLYNQAESKNALLVTTEKDWVRLSTQDKEKICPLPIRLKFSNHDFDNWFLERINAS